MFVSPKDIIEAAEKESEDAKSADPNQAQGVVPNMQIFTRMAPGGDKTNTIDINQLKIFLKFQTFILL